MVVWKTLIHWLHNFNAPGNRGSFSENIMNLTDQLNLPTVKHLPRPYLGMSQVGDPCRRSLQYYHYWAYEIEISRRIQRLFDFGHMMEKYMIQDLCSIGVIVSDTQVEIVGLAEHWKGHIDGKGFIVSDKDGKFLVEFKTHSDKNFKKLVKLGAEKGFPGHYDQVISYSGELKLPKTLYVGYNKNNSEYWLEWIESDSDHLNALQRKQLDVLASDVMLPRIGNGSPSWFECKFCDARNVCYGRSLPPVTCRTCLHVDVENGGKWKCTHLDKYLSVEEQTVACPKYNLAPMFKE